MSPETGPGHDEGWETEKRQPEPAPAIKEINSFPEAHRQAILNRHQEVSKILGHTLPVDLVSSFLSQLEFTRTADTGVEQAYGIDPLAICQPDGKIEIFESFFGKTPEEQQYILAHEFSHNVVNRSVFASRERLEQARKLGAASQLAGETTYTRHVIEQQRLGQLTEDQVLAEQMAERTSAYLLGRGDLVGMLQVQALYMDNPGELFAGVPPEALADPELLGQFIAENPEANPLISDTVAYHQLIKTSLDSLGSDDEMEDELDWDLPAIESQGLGSSRYLDSYRAQANQPNGPTTLWSFLREVLFSQSA